MGFYAEHLLPRLVDRALDTPACRRERARITHGLRGNVLEIGFGSGLNLPYYPAEVTRVLAVDPVRVGEKLAQERIRRCPAKVEFVGLDGQALPLPEASVDGVLSTWTLCTIPDPHRALAEIRRVLRPQGMFHFLEHGLAPEPRTARFQRLLNPLWRRIAGGCHLTRDIAGLVENAGFSLVDVRTFSLPRTPRAFGFMYTGVAT